MDVVWSATEVRTRRFRPTPVRSGPAELDEHFQRLRRRRIRGYIEAEIPGSPQLTIGFRGEYAVVLLLVAEPLRLAGDGTVPAEAYVQVPIMDDLTRFTGDVVLGVDHARELVQAFLRTGRPGDLGKWLPLADDAGHGR